MSISWDRLDAILADPHSHMPLNGPSGVELYLVRGITYDEIEEINQSRALAQLHKTFHDVGLIPTASFLDVARCTSAALEHERLVLADVSLRATTKPPKGGFDDDIVPMDRTGSPETGSFVTGGLNLLRAFAPSDGPQRPPIFPQITGLPSLDDVLGERRLSLSFVDTLAFAGAYYGAMLGTPQGRRYSFHWVSRRFFQAAAVGGLISTLGAGMFHFLSATGLPSPSLIREAFEGPSSAKAKEAVTEMFKQLGPAVDSAVKDKYNAVYSLGLMLVGGAPTEREILNTAMRETGETVLDTSSGLRKYTDVAKIKAVRKLFTGSVGGEPSTEGAQRLMNLLPSVTPELLQEIQDASIEEINKAASTTTATVREVAARMRFAGETPMENFWSTVSEKAAASGQFGLHGLARLRGMGAWATANPITTISVGSGVLVGGALLTAFAKAHWDARMARKATIDEYAAFVTRPPEDATGPSLRRSIGQLKACNASLLRRSSELAQVIDARQDDVERGALGALVFAVQSFNAFRQAIQASEPALLVMIDATRGVPAAAQVYPALFDPQIDVNQRNLTLGQTAKQNIDSLRTQVRVPILRRLAFVLGVPANAEAALLLNCAEDDIPWADAAAGGGGGPPGGGDGGDGSDGGGGGGGGGGGDPPAPDVPGMGDDDGDGGVDDDDGDGGGSGGGGQRGRRRARPSEAAELLRNGGMRPQRLRKRGFESVNEIIDDFLMLRFGRM
jgi:uncharacterized membrane protein YgcG